jgi:hypothetical protein
MKTYEQDTKLSDDVVKNENHTESNLDKLLLRVKRRSYEAIFSCIVHIMDRPS